MTERPRTDLENKVYVWIVRFVAWLMRRLDVRRTETGTDHVPREGGAVLAISHFSYLDFVMSEWTVFDHTRRYTRFMATKAAFTAPLVGRLMTAMGHIPVDRKAGASAYRFAVEALERGEIVGVFPETRVSRSFTLLPFKTGAARMAAQAGVPIVPCVIFGSHRVKTRTHRVPLWKARHIPVDVRFGAPITCTPKDDPAVVTEELRLAMTQLLEAAMDDYPLEQGAWWVPAHRGGGAPTADDAIALDAREQRAS